MRTARSVAPQYRAQVAVGSADPGRATQARPSPARPTQAQPARLTGDRSAADRSAGTRLAGNRLAESRPAQGRPGETRTGAVPSVGSRFASGPARADRCGSSRHGDGLAQSGRVVSSGDRVPRTVCREAARNGVGPVSGGVGRGGTSGTAPGGTALRTGRDRVCTASPRGPGGPRGAREERRSRVERVLVGVAVALCSAAVVVVLGLVADLAAASHAGDDAGPRTVQQVEGAVPAAHVR